VCVCVVLVWFGFGLVRFFFSNFGPGYVGEVFRVFFFNFF
jgi:hypothetical protein